MALLGTTEWAGNVVKHHDEKEMVTDVIHYTLTIDERLNITGKGRIEQPAEEGHGLKWEKQHDAMDFEVSEGVVRVLDNHITDDNPFGLDDDGNELPAEVEFLFLEEMLGVGGGRNGSEHVVASTYTLKLSGHRQGEDNDFYTNTRKSVHASFDDGSRINVFHDDDESKDARIIVGWGFDGSGNRHLDRHRLVMHENHAARTALPIMRGDNRSRETVGVDSVTFGAAGLRGAANEDDDDVSEPGDRGMQTAIGLGDIDVEDVADVDGADVDDKNDDSKNDDTKKDSRPAPGQSGPSATTSASEGEHVKAAKGDVAEIPIDGTHLD